MGMNKVKGINLALTDWQKKEIEELTDKYSEGTALIAQIISTSTGYILKVVLLDKEMVNKVQEITGMVGEKVEKDTGVYVITGR